MNKPQTYRTLNQDVSWAWVHQLRFQVAIIRIFRSTRYEEGCNALNLVVVVIPGIAFQDTFWKAVHQLEWPIAALVVHITDNLVFNARN